MLSGILLCLGLLFLAYFFYTRIWRFYRKVNYYKSQGVPFHEGVVPVFGSFLQIAKIAKNAVNHPIVDFCEEYYYKGKKMVPPFVAVTGPAGVALAVARPSVVAELFVNKNKYFDKHPTTARQLQRMTGDSILFAPSDLKWQQKRKALSAALYKDKLKDMIELMKQVTI